MGEKEKIEFQAPLQDGAAQKVTIVTMRTPFPSHQVSKLPKGTKAQNDCKAEEKVNCTVCGGWHHPKIKHLDYVGHAALTDRLLDVDPAWCWEPLALKEGLPAFDGSGGLWIKLTVNGITRIGYGNAVGKQHMDIGAREKEVIGDALRNAAMRFGAALDLWHKGVLHLEEDEEPEKKKAVTGGAVEQLPQPNRVIVPADLTRQVIAQSLSCLANNDAHGLKQIWEEFTTDEQAFLWRKFDSTQRSEMKKLTATLKNGEVE